MRFLAKAGVLAILAFGLAGCGNTTGERALTGGALGAGAGAGVGALTGGSAGTGALIGGGLGAVTGAATSRSQLDLGDTVW